jgi:hypothetical protein
MKKTTKKTNSNKCLEWTGPIKDCICSSIDIERRECQGHRSCKCGKTKW